MKKNGFFNKVLKFFGVLAGIGLALAIIGLFNGDVFSVFIWIGELMLKFIYTVRDFFLGNTTFRSIAN